jgi:hypothetical protein
MDHLLGMYGYKNTKAAPGHNKAQITMEKQQVICLEVLSH